MRKKTENMDIIVDKKTVRITTAVFVTVMTMLAAIAAMFFTTMSVLAADAGSSSNSQSTISTTVPDSHNIRVEKSHADVVIEGEEDQIAMTPGYIFHPQSAPALLQYSRKRFLSH